MCAAPSPPAEPYGSARDLPSFQEMETLLRGFKLFGPLMPKSTRSELRTMRAELDRLVTTVDVFYATLGGRQWIFTGDLHLDQMDGVIEAPTPEDAERRLVAYYKDDDHVRFPLLRLNRFDAMRPRIDLLNKAHADFKAGRYYSTVLLLIAVMDGFVNDFEKEQRRGLHTRTDDEMFAWDSVTGHHLGLQHAHRSFVKKIKKRIDSPVTDLHRNGIMHGMITDFDNDIVAAKAWNRLFAVADWADSRLKQAKPIEPSPTLRETLATYRGLKERRKVIDTWSPRAYDLEDLHAGEQPEIVSTCAAFLECWARQQWGPLSEYFIRFGTDELPFGTRARNARDLYDGNALNSWTITRVRHTAASIAHVDVNLVVNDEPYDTALRWIRTDATSSPVLESEPGRWALSPYGPAVFLERQHDQEDEDDEDDEDDEA